MASSSPVKLALLLCDTPVPSVLESYGTYIDIFRNQLVYSNPQADFPFSLDGFDVVTAQEYPDLDAGYAGVLISGSSASAYDNKPWIAKLISWVAETANSRPEIKLIGICFGHQIIALALGGECVPNNGIWEVGTTEFELTDVGKAVFKTDKQSIAIQQMHRDHVPFVPPSFHLLGSTEVTPVQGLIRLHPSADAKAFSEPSNIHIFTVQGHPEFISDIVNKVIDVREKSGVMNAETAADGRERAIKDHDGIGAIGRAIWRVLGVDAKA